MELVRDESASIDPDRAGNTVIEGDNLSVMRLLPEASVDLIYIDPPYNTGNDFAYRDVFREGEGGRATRHRAWAEMMRPRLVEAARLLRPHGAIFCSIDDHEVAALRHLLDDTFGPDNFLATIAVNLNPKGRQLGPWFATSHEYLHVYARDARRCALDATSADTVDPEDFPLVDDATGRRYRHLPLRNTNKKFNPVTSPTLHYPLWGDEHTGSVSTTPFDGGREILPVFGDGTPAVWRWSRPRVDARPDDLVCRTVRSPRGPRVDIHQKDWLHTGRRKKLPTIWLAEEVGSTDTAVAEVRQLVGKVFESPKPTGLLRRVLGTYPDDAVVLDFFAGSGTTGHATALANVADGGSRRCLSINSAEPTREGSEARRHGFPTVAAITRARLRAVAEQVGGGLEVLRLQD